MNEVRSIVVVKLTAENQTNGRKPLPDAALPTTQQAQD